MITLLNQRTVMSRKKIQWTTVRKGVRCYKHETRKHGKKFDRYFAGIYRIGKKQVQMGFGWESEGWTELEVERKVRTFKKNAQKGVKPSTLKEELATVQQENKEIAANMDPENPKNFNIRQFYEKVYLPAAEAEANGNGKKQKNIESDKSYFKLWLLPALGELRFADAKKSHFMEIKTTMLNAGRAARSLQQCFSIFGKLWNHASDYDLVTGRNPAQLVKRPKVDNKNTRYFSPEEASLLLADLKTRSMEAHDMALFSIHTGARRGEIFDITWAVINFDNKSVVLRDAKGKTRHSYLSGPALEMLHRKCAACKNPEPKARVFVNSRGNRYSEVPRSYNRAMDNLRFNHGVDDSRDKATFHTCRHTFASWHVQHVGTDLYILKDLMGHSTIQLTERYAHLRENLPKTAAQNFNNFVNA